MANRGSHIDIIEMDAASNRKIDDIRDLIEQTQYQPSIGRFKIFIIDEVHMLTKEAFNALLKTLEEPPSYVKFILATTDPLKLPQTILSRTQHFSFKRIDKHLVAQHLKDILHRENIEFDDESIETISRSGGGSLRDTLTTLQQAIVYCGNSLDIGSVTEMLGLVDPQTLENVLSLVLSKKREELIEAIKSISSYDSEMVLDEFINLLKQKLFSSDIEPNTLQKMFEAVNSGKRLLFTGADSEFVLYLTFLKMISDDIVTKVVEVQQVQKSEAQPQKMVVPADGSDKSFFWNSVIPEVIISNPLSSKITDEILQKCMESHIEFIDFNGKEVSLQFCFRDSESCKKVLRARYGTIQAVSIQQFNKRSGKKSQLKYLECEEVKREFQPDKPIELGGVQTEKVEEVSMDQFIESLKETFGSDKIVEKPR
jgi:DNA polymerase-3 subunit gamma/tau